MGNLYSGMILITRTPTGEVAAWLNGNCEGQWDLHPAAIGADGITKRLMVLFETERDRLRFEDRFSDHVPA